MEIFIKKPTLKHLAVIAAFFLVLYGNLAYSEPSVGIEVEMPGTMIVMAKFDDSRPQGKKWITLDWQQEQDDGYDYKVLSSLHSSSDRNELNKFTNALELRTDHCDRGNYKYCEFELVSAPVVLSNYQILTDRKIAYQCFYTTAQKRDWTSQDGKKSIAGMGSFIPASKFIEAYHACLSNKIPSNAKRRPWMVKEEATKNSMTWYFLTNATAAATQVNYGVPLSRLVKGKDFIKFFSPGSAKTTWEKAQDGAYDLKGLLPQGHGLTDEHLSDLEGLFAHVLAMYGKGWNTKDSYDQMIKTYPTEAAKVLINTINNKNSIGGLKDEAWQILKSKYGIQMLREHTNELDFKNNWSDTFKKQDKNWNYADKPLDPEVFGNHVGVVIESRTTNSDFNKGFRPNATKAQFDKSLKKLKDLLGIN